MATLEEEPQGEDRYLITVAVAGVKNLPSALSTRVQVRGFGTDVTSSPVEAVLTKDTSTGRDEQCCGGWTFGDGDDERTDVVIPLEWSTETCSLLLREQLEILVLEDGKTTPIAEMKVDLRELIHEKTDLGGDALLTLSEEYAAIWDEEKEDDEGNPVPPSEHRSTVLTWSVGTQSELGPKADRSEGGAWTCLEVEVTGMASLPPACALGTSGGANPSDPESHPLQYTLSMLGLKWEEGALTSVEENEEEGAPEPQASLQWESNTRTEYRGTTFLTKFREMLDLTGGVWLKIAPERKDGDGAADPKAKGKGAAAGAAPEEVEAALTALAARVFVDLRCFQTAGVRSHQIVTRVDPSEFVPPERAPTPEEEQEEDPTEAAREAWAKEKPYAAAGTEITMIVRLRDPIVPPLEQQPPELTIPDVLGDPEDQENLVPLAGCPVEASLQLDAAVQNALRVISAAGLSSSVRIDKLLEFLKETGAYGQLAEELQDALTAVAREKMRTHSDALPAAAKAGASNAPGGRGLTEEIRRKVLAELYVTAQDSCVGLVTATNPVVPISGGTTEERRATDVLRAASSIADTAALVAYELEVFIDGPPKYSDSGPPGSIAARAAEQWQTQLCMAQNRSSIELWRGYARFCARVGRKEAAEEALQHIIWNKAQAAESSITATEDNPEVDCAHPDVMKRFLQNAEKERRAEACDLILNYAMLLLDRERYVEAERACRAVLDMDRSDPMHNLGYALMLWLRNMAGQGEAEDLENVKKFASLARKPLDFFKGLTHGTDKQLFDKLRLFDRDEVSDSEEEKNLPTLLLVPSPEEIAGCRFARVLIEYGAPRLALEMLAQEAPREGYPPFPVLAQHTKVSCPLVAHLRARSAMRQRDWPKARSMAKDLVYAKYVDDDGAHTSPQLWADYAECLYWLGEDPAPAAVKVIDTVESLLPPEFVEPPSPVPGCRAGSSFMDRGDLRESMRQFQVSIRVEPTAIAWYGLAMAAYRSGEDAVSFEALTECTVRNSDHPETFALLALWHCRAGTIELAKHAFVTMMEKPATPDLDLLIEVGWAMLGAYVPFAFAAGRRALSLRDEGQGHFLLGEAWVADGQPAQGVLEMAIAVGMFWEDTDTRQKVYDRALEVCEALQDAPLRESVNFSMRKADEKLAAFREEEERQRRRANEKKAREEEA